MTWALCWCAGLRPWAFSPQCLCHHHPLELPTDDAGLEERSMLGSRQHPSTQASTGEPAQCAEGSSCLQSEHKHTLINNTPLSFSQFTDNSSYIILKFSFLKSVCQENHMYVCRGQRTMPPGIWEPYLGHWVWCQGLYLKCHFAEAIHI